MVIVGITVGIGIVIVVRNVGRRVVWICINRVVVVETIVGRVKV